MQLGLDIGGANLKLAHTNGTARTVPFELWKQPTQLQTVLAALVASAPPHDGIAVTMTGELCDCFETKCQGVHAIVDAVEASCRGSPIAIWRNDGQWVDCHTARQTPYQVAAANWLALATFAGRFARREPALLIDVGSTTTDIIPLLDGEPMPQGRTDSERLLSGELVYRGVRRTPILWCARSPLAAELFATTLDAFLLLESIREDPADQQTADGRPATRAFAHARLSRMLCGDGETCSQAATLELARSTAKGVVNEISRAINQVVSRLPAHPQSIVIAGSGEFLAAEVVARLSFVPPAAVESLTARLGPDISSAACAYAVAVLAEERAHGR
jgi:(4-(4-[2-(gamma-L-glutamylamino)ethyl]phenoxymethyl)furan-2-yl)methanamine synthase